MMVYMPMDEARTFHRRPLQAVWEYRARPLLSERQRSLVMRELSSRVASKSSCSAWSESQRERSKQDVAQGRSGERSVSVSKRSGTAMGLTLRSQEGGCDRPRCVPPLRDTAFYGRSQDARQRSLAGQDPTALGIYVHQRMGHLLACESNQGQRLSRGVKAHRRWGREETPCVGR